MKRKILSFIILFSIFIIVTRIYSYYATRSFYRFEAVIHKEYPDISYTKAYNSLVTRIYEPTYPSNYRENLNSIYITLDYLNKVHLFTHDEINSRKSLKVSISTNDRIVKKANNDTLCVLHFVKNDTIIRMFILIDNSDFYDRMRKYTENE